MSKSKRTPRARPLKKEKKEKMVAPSKALSAAYGSSRTSTSTNYRIKHRELVDAVGSGPKSFGHLGSSNYTPGYDLSPSNPILFPWLHRIAGGYEKFRVHSCTVELVPHNPTTVGGVCYIAFDYDYDDPVATSPSDLMVNSGAVSGDVWTSHKLSVNIARMNQDLVWRYCAAPSRAETTPRFVYGGYFQFAIANTSANTSFDIFIEYDIEFSLPSLHYVNITDSQESSNVVLPSGEEIPFTSLPIVSSGLPVVPISSTPIGGFASVPGALAYALAPGLSGLLRVNATMSTAAQPPSAYASDTRLSGSFFDSLGTLLGYVNTVTGHVAYQGVDEPADWGVGGRAGYCQYGLDTKYLRDVFPRARYFVPWILSSGGRTLAALAIGARYFQS